MSSPFADAGVPARMLNEWVYCPRLFHLMHVQGLFAPSAETVLGTGEHDRMRARSRGAGLEPPPEPWRGDGPREVSFDAPAEGVVGRFDVVSGTANGLLVPVEAKHGSAPAVDRAQEVCGIALEPGAWNNDQVQVGAQAMLLRAAGEQCDEARIWYRKSNTTVRLRIDDNLLAATRATVAGAHATSAGPMPPPLVDSPKCIGCSLVDICLPDETNCLLHRQSEPPRKVVAGRLDGGGLYVLCQGGRIGKTSETLTVAAGEESTEVPLKDIEHAAVFGNVQVTTQALQTLALHGKPLHLHSQGGRLLASLVPAGRPNLQLRREQFRAADRPERCLPIARWIVAAKIRNQRVLLRRNDADGVHGETVEQLAGAARRAEEAADLPSLLGIEGDAARRWFGCLSNLLGEDQGLAWLTGRTRRPPADPGNALLSFGYALLVGECAAALQRVGLDADLGFYHQAVPGRPALALDLMEPFRPLIVDSLALRMIRTGQLHRTDFAQIGDGWRLHDAARRRVVSAFEQRMDELITHPLFDYRMSYRRVLEVEARLLGRHLTGEFAEWRPLVTR